MESSLVLTQGEEVQATLKGELIPNILVRLLMFITCVRMEAQLIVTNKRVVIETKRFTCCCIPAAATFQSIPYRGLASVEYSFAATCICGLCRQYILSVTQNSGDTFGFVIKGGENEASQIANTIIQNM